MKQEQYENGLHDAYKNGFGPGFCHICSDSNEGMNFAWWFATKGSNVRDMRREDTIRHYRVCHKCGTRLTLENLQDCSIKYSKNEKVIEKVKFKFFKFKKKIITYDATVLNMDGTKNFTCVDRVTSKTAISKNIEAKKTQTHRLDTIE